MEQILMKLQEAEVGKVVHNEPLAKHTTIKIGGPAEIFVEPNSIEDLKKTMDIVTESGVPWRAIGRGSNLLVGDSGIKGVVIKLGKGLDHLEVDGDTITAGGGYSLIKLTTVISKQGLSGLQFAGGIPGSVGGAVYMNAGAHGSDMSKILVKAHILFEDGTMEWLTAEELDFSYRTSLLQKKRPGICLEAVLKLDKGNREEIVAELQKNKDYRRETQPWDHPNCGSVFRNPLPHYAGQLIQESGLKGYQIGGAKISELHGNFIVNTGNATAKDVLDLIDFVKKTIYEKHAVKMETEVEIVGVNE
ncbi:UDP-N-acetylmuramate dehydrogenase [Metabacillus idriensis]|uniref:UDP-N-acetylmuramate dehydrogenase n=1 Tax=Metabacillus idriensis TaxID=324768 RepID=UPI0008A8609F|nr:UDP-N-acetylmuramate dehydrogenase [Metabacillus idriensis]MCM3594403.1 UDP-N-acetylmuramate dehydrogenase [Metabacillus idriensis]OHR72911.1 UDP-N-acetylenolpyruvoylglucosamine reductase [Bacillus sp. HMSC76G11]